MFANKNYFEKIQINKGVFYAVQIVGKKNCCLLQKNILSNEYNINV